MCHDFEQIHLIGKSLIDDYALCISMIDIFAEKSEKSKLSDIIA
jgi:hypothetical protein